jgi:hypothetical protein
MEDGIHSSNADKKCKRIGQTENSESKKIPGDNIGIFFACQNDDLWMERCIHSILTNGFFQKKRLPLL